MIRIMMLGIDHNASSIDEREKFSFTKQQAAHALAQLKEEESVSGCLILSTCNRTELWVSGREDTDMAGLMEKISGESSPHFVERQGDEAVDHLYHLACGLKSQLTGEDQILTQIKEAFSMAQGCQCGDTVLNRAFGGAICAAKKVKANVRISSISPSAAKSAVALMREKLGDLRGVSCLIIGNGQIGKLLAEDLIRRDAHVTMTLRKQIHGRERQESILPPGCQMIPYEDRVEHLKHHKCVISATLSPHFTIRSRDIAGAEVEGERLYLDLAVPRDIEAGVGNHPGIRLYNMDQISATYHGEGEERSRMEAEAILNEAIEELRSHLAFETVLPAVEHISTLMKEDMTGRMKTQDAEVAAEKSLRKLLFGLRKHLPREEWEPCFSALEKAAMDDTVKTGERHQYEED